MKRFIVLGGTGYIGSQVLKILHEHDSEVFFSTHRNETLAADLSQKYSASYAACDLSDPQSIGFFFEGVQKKMDGVDGLVVATGTGGKSEYTQRKQKEAVLEKLGVEEIQEIFQINIQSLFTVCQKALPLLKAHTSNVLFLGSMDGLKPVPSPLHFAASKSALKGFVEALAKEWGSQKICVNQICPGILEGGASKNLGEAFKAPYLKHSALKRFGRAEEVARVIAWFLFKNTYMTGQSILLDGGL